MFVFLCLIFFSTFCQEIKKEKEFNSDGKIVKFYPFQWVRTEISLIHPKFPCTLSYKDWNNALFDWTSTLHPSTSNEIVRTLINTSTSHIFFLDCVDSSAYFQVLPGKHIYDLNEILKSQTKPKQEKKPVRVVSTFDLDYCPKRFILESTWRDAIRTAAFRENVKLCFCGAGNTSSAHTLNSPNNEFPDLVIGPDCDCSEINSIPYNFLLPCNHGESTAEYDAINLTNCDLLDSKQIEETRVHAINGVMSGWDKTCLKSRLWRSLKTYFGEERAKMLMPASYDLQACDAEVKPTGNPIKLCEIDKIKERVEKEEKNGDSPTIYVTKNPILSRQQGVSLSHGKEILDGLKNNFNFATEYIPNPFLMNGYKINLRRYLLLVCTGDRLRAYVHDDGKNFYGKLPYKTPNDGVYEWRGNETLNREYLDRIVTTGYVPMSHYNDKPMTGTQFFDLMKNERNVDLSSLRKSMHTRLALMAHMSNQKFSIYDGYLEEHTACLHKNPPCLKNAVRSIHLGCDFQIDRELTGYNSRLFECNKGPDMHVHNIRDGALKLGVAADIATFLGLSGPFNDSHEHARKNNLTKIYDSFDFDADSAFEYLESLKDLPPLDQQENKEEKNEL